MHQTFLEWLPADVVASVATSVGKAIGVLQRDAKELAGILLDRDLNEQAVTDADADCDTSSRQGDFAKEAPSEAFGSRVC